MLPAPSLLPPLQPIALLLPPKHLPKPLRHSIRNTEIIEKPLIRMSSIVLELARILAARPAAVAPTPLMHTRLVELAGAARRAELWSGNGGAGAGAGCCGHCG